MNKNLIKNTVITTVSSAIFLSAILMPAFAQTLTPKARKAANDQQRISTLISRGDSEIAKRITSLNTAITRVNSAKKLTDAQKQALVATDQTVISTLNSLKTKIDADTDLETLKNDVRSIFSSVRVYALVLPQEAIVAAADRQLEIASDLSALADKLTTRISDAQSKRKDVTALQSSLNDMKSKLTYATTQANAAINGVINLKSDLGNASVAASNKQALESARTNIKTGKSDIQTSYNDAKSIVAGLKSM